MKIITLSLLSLLFSTAAFSNSTLTVIKEATLCKGNSCSYTNPSYELSCEFSSEGTVKIKKTQTFGMVGPTIPLFYGTKFLSKEDSVKLTELLSAIEGEANAPKVSNSVERVRYVLLGSEYAIHERYIQKTSDANELWLAQNFSSSSRQMDLPEVDQVVELADSYCGWTFLTKR